jgi:NhaA family Na+:H+ antiporter
MKEVIRPPFYVYQIVAGIELNKTTHLQLSIQCSSFQKMNLSKLFNEFIDSEKSGGIVLLAATGISMAISNMQIGDSFAEFWKTDIGGHTIVHWINDGLMTIFFLLIGLELEREIYTGELSSLRKASLPIFAAIGGMLFPAAIFMLFNHGTETSRGVGIPMATDIAFSIGLLSLLGSRVPPSLKIFLAALAVIDDLGAIIIIAVFYSGNIIVLNLAIALSIFIVLIILNRINVTNLLPYIIGGILMWYFMLHSGVHSTITGVLLAFSIPFAGGGESSPSYRLQHYLHRPVAFIILPVFAIANMAMPLEAGIFSELGGNLSNGIIAGLVGGKPAGILIFSVLAIMAGVSQMPEGIMIRHLFGAGLLAGIGFTMSIFISVLAFDSPEIVNAAKISILIASIVAGICGLLWLRLTLKR